MDELVYPHERRLGAITLVLGIIVWLLLILGTFGGALLALAFSFILYLFAQSALIAHIKGNGVELTATQFPDLHAQFLDCCRRLQISKPPQAYILYGQGGMNAFATRFLGTQYVVLLSDVVDAMREHPDGVRFYLGHELGHLRMKHLSGALLRWPVLWLPILGAAYSRARESTCDRHGLACSSSAEGAARALAALSAGTQRWQTLDIASYQGQVRHSSGFWMSFHELITAYPWLTKRVTRVMGTQDSIPARHPLAYVLALFVPFAGRLGGGFGFLMMVYIIALLAAVALPTYRDYTVKAKLETTVHDTRQAREHLAQYYEKNQQVPESLQAASIPPQISDDATLSLDTDTMVLSVKTMHGELLFVPTLAENGHIIWNCHNGPGIKPAQLPPSCQTEQLNQ